MKPVRYAVLFEKTRTGYGAHIPDLPGCVAAGRSLAQTKRLITSAMAFHIEGMTLDGESVPDPTTIIEYIAPTPSVVPKTVAAEPLKHE